MQFFAKLLDTSDFPARWYCGTWSEAHGWLHVISDVMTGLAYTAIPIVLMVFILRRKDLVFPRVFWLFTAFILACGSVHFVEALIFWVPVYRVSGLLKMATAIVSCATVVALIQVFPKALDLPGLATINDELRREIAARQQAEQKLALIVENISEAVVFANQQGEFQIWNEAAGQIIGERPDDVIPEQWAERFQVFDSKNEALVPTESLPLYRALQGEDVRAFELVLRTKGNARLVCHASPVRDTHQEMLGAVMTARDITDARKAHEEREQHFQQLQRVTQLAVEVASLMDGPPEQLKKRLLGMIRTITGSSVAAIGIRRPDGATHIVVSRNEPPDLEETVTDCDQLLDSGILSEKCVCRNLISDLPIVNTVRNMIAVRVDVRAQAMGWFLAGDRETSFSEDDVNSIRQITEIAGPVLVARNKLEAEARQRAEVEMRLKQRQIELEQLARSSTLGELTTTLAHELNQPLTTIANLAIASANGLEANQLDHSAIRTTLISIKDQALRSGRILKTVRELVQHSDETHNLEVVELRSLIGDVVKLVSPDLQRSSVILRCEIPDGLYVYINPTRIQQVLLNLIRNAVDAIQGAKSPEILIACQRIDDGQIETRIQDNGPGFQHPDKAFQAFYTTKPTGVGIGLKLCHSIVEACGGRIAATNCKSGGAVVTFSLQEEVTLGRPKVAT